jgi:hypothetical protein
MLKMVFVILVLVYSGWIPLCRAQTILVAKPVSQGPVIDGREMDTVWQDADPIQVRDPIGGIDILLKAAHTRDRIFFLLRFPDPDESRLHKPWVWNYENKEYRLGADREDCVVLKWAMNSATEDLSIHADQPYTADVWFWKAHRTDPAGYADDKFQKLMSIGGTSSMGVTSRSGSPMFLTRQGDLGKSAYVSTIEIDFIGEKIVQYKHRKPTLSRADIRARGKWDQGYWCVEMARLLNTGHLDDVQFDLNQTYLFGVSRYEIAGRKPDPGISQPLYGSGDVSARLILKFDPES